jgi:hypothetical protein
MIETIYTLNQFCFWCVFLLTDADTSVRFVAKANAAMKQATFAFVPQVLGVYSLNG